MFGIGHLGYLGLILPSIGSGSGGGGSIFVQTDAGVNVQTDAGVQVTTT